MIRSSPNGSLRTVKEGSLNADDLGPGSLCGCVSAVGWRDAYVYGLFPPCLIHSILTCLLVAVSFWVRPAILRLWNEKS